jgi:hypothetical protein
MVAAAVVGAGLTSETGLYGRLTLAVPGLFASAGLALYWVPVWLRGRVPAAAAYSLVALLIAFVAWYNLTSYFGNPDAPSEYYLQTAGAHAAFPPF